MLASIGTNLPACARLQIRSEKNAPKCLVESLLKVVSGCGDDGNTCMRRSFDWKAC